MYGISFKEALEKIAIDLGIVSTGSPKHIAPIKQEQLEQLKGCDKVNLKIKSRKPTQSDKDFWLQFGINGKTLVKYNVKAVELVFVNNHIIRPKSQCYAYLELKDGNPTYKVYQPYDKTYKFMNNNDYSVWEGWTQMPHKGDRLIITSSRKDVMSIVSTTGENAVALQSESVFPKPQIIEELKSRFKEIFIFYDNDFQSERNNGRIYGEGLAREFGLKQIEIPDKYQCKDYSDPSKDLWS